MEWGVYSDIPLDGIVSGRGGIGRRGASLWWKHRSSSLLDRTIFNRASLLVIHPCRMLKAKPATK